MTAKKTAARTKRKTTAKQSPKECSEQYVRPRVREKEWRTTELAKEILDEIATGNSLRSICEKKGLPLSTTFDWIRGNHLEAYKQAKEDMVFYLEDELLYVARNARNDTLMNDGKEVSNPSAVARARLICDNLKWVMSKQMPKKYGDKVDVNATIKPDAAASIRDVVGLFDEAFGSAEIRGNQESGEN